MVFFWFDNDGFQPFITLTAPMIVPPAQEEEFSVETREASPAHLLIRIESFSLLSKNGIEEYESREFEAGDHKWRFIIYPNGDKIGKKSGHISVYLSMVDIDSLPVECEVNVMFNVFLFNQIRDNYTCFRGKVRRFNAINNKWGFSKLISKRVFKDTSNGYLVDDNCVFGVEVFVVKRQRVIERVSIGEVYSPYKHDLVIPHFSKLELEWESDEFLEWESDEFSAGEYRWKIKLYPNGHRRGGGDYVSIYLECVDSASFAPHEKMMVDICIRMKNKNHDKHCTYKFSKWYSSSGTTWGHLEFIKNGDMRDSGKGFVVDDCCYLEIEIRYKATTRDAPK